MSDQDVFSLWCFFASGFLLCLNVWASAEMAAASAAVEDLGNAISELEARLK